MKSFFKIFFASLLALFIFTLMGFFLLIGIVSLASSEDKSTIDSRAILVLDLSQSFPEQSKNDPFAAFMNKTENDQQRSFGGIHRLRTDYMHVKNKRYVIPEKYLDYTIIDGKNYTLGYPSTFAGCKIF